MQVNFFGPDPAFHEARRHFVFKGNPPTDKSISLIPEPTKNWRQARAADYGPSPHQTGQYGKSPDRPTWPKHGQISCS